jgi:hypothetical protein
MELNESAIGKNVPEMPNWKSRRTGLGSPLQSGKGNVCTTTLEPKTLFDKQVTSTARVRPLLKYCMMMNVSVGKHVSFCILMNLSSQL